MKVLVTGGAGYIGSHTIVKLIEAGHKVVSIDNFSNSDPSVFERIDSITGEKVLNYGIDLTWHSLTEEIFNIEQPDAVIHFAGFKAVGESVKKPMMYYENNLESAMSIVSAMRHSGCDKLVFSSSATVYGDIPSPLKEDQKQLSSTNPYGWTKVMIEQMLTDAANASNLKVALLRYFNPVGAHPSGKIGEKPIGIPNNIMPYISQTAAGLREKLTIFGQDYPTVDGTCERDYIHVEDLAEGHIEALDRISRGDINARAWNLGRGKSTSVLQLVQEFEAATGMSVPFEFGERREGDLAVVWADVERAQRELNWKATRDVSEMCIDAWRWESRKSSFPKRFTL